jgi:hypothetical protein
VQLLALYRLADHVHDGVHVHLVHRVHGQSRRKDEAEKN